MQWCQKQWDRQSIEALLLNSIANPALLNSPFWFIEEGSSSNISTSRPMLGRELPLHALAIQKEEKHLIWSMSWHSQGVVHRWARSGWEFTAPVCLLVQLSRLSPAQSSNPEFYLCSTFSACDWVWVRSALWSGPGWICLQGREKTALWTGFRVLLSPCPAQDQSDSLIPIWVSVSWASSPPTGAREAKLYLYLS